MGSCSGGSDGPGGCRLGAQPVFQLQKRILHLKDRAFQPGHRRISDHSPQDIGPLRDFYPVSEQSHQLYGVLDYRGKRLEIEAGVGFGLTAASDGVTLKLLLSRDLN